MWRSQNSYADSLATLASSLDECIPRMIFVELLEQRVVVVAPLVVEPSWLDPYIAFLSDGCLPTNVKKAEKVRRMSARFWLFEDKKLYWDSFGGPYLLCLHPSKIVELLTELHEGICGGHSGGRLLAHRAMTQGFWWPNMQRETIDYIKKCDQCQKHVPIMHQLRENLNLIISPWPFT